MVRTVKIAAFALCFAMPVLAAAQQKGDSKKPAPASSVSNTVEASWAAGAGIPSRTVQTRTEANGREVVTEKTETPGPDGKFRMSRETTTETVRTGSDSTQTKHEVYADDGQGRRRLVETTQTEVTTARDGSSHSVADTMAPDL